MQKALTNNEIGNLEEELDVLIYSVNNYPNNNTHLKVVPKTLDINVNIYRNLDGFLENVWYIVGDENTKE